MKTIRLNKKGIWFLMSAIILLVLAAILLIYTLDFSDNKKEVYTEQIVETESTMQVRDAETAGSVNRAYGQETLEDSSYDTGPEIKNEAAKTGETIKVPAAVAEAEESSGTKYIQPDISILKSMAEEYISNIDGTYGLYYMDIANNVEFGINHMEEFTAASTVKVPMNLYLFTKMYEGELDPEKKLVYTKKDYEEGTGILYREEFGNEYTIRELCRLSIEVSDNVATNILLRMMTRTALKEYMRELGGTVVVDGRNVSCPKDMALYLKHVYNFYFEGGEYGEELISYLENSIFNERIPKLLPDDVKVAHKIGNLTQIYHDIGIIFAKNPYILSIMSKDVLMEDSFKAIQELSKMVYDFTNDIEKPENQ